MKTWSFFVDAFIDLQVSEPLGKTGLMLELKSLSFVHVVMFLELQVFLIAAKVVNDFRIIILMSTSACAS